MDGSFVKIMAFTMSTSEENFIAPLVRCYVWKNMSKDVGTSKFSLLRLLYKLFSYCKHISKKYDVIGVI